MKKQKNILNFYLLILFKLKLIEKSKEIENLIKKTQNYLL